MSAPSPRTEPHPALDELPTDWRSRLLDTYTDLRTLAAETSDPNAKRQALAIATSLLSTVWRGEPSIHLTSREHDVLTMLGHGLPNRKIAANLGISLHTVKTHVQNLMLKLHATTRFEAVVEARRRSLLP